MKTRKRFETWAVLGLLLMLLLALGATPGSGSSAPAAPLGWRITTIPGDTNQGTFSSIVVDQDGNPHISFIDVSNKEVKYVRRDGSTWQAQTIDTLETLGFLSTSLALNGVGQPRIAYNYNNPVLLGLAEWDGSQWQNAFINPSGSILYTDLALKDDGEPCVSYYVTRPGSYPTYVPVRNIEVFCRTAGVWPQYASMSARYVNYKSDIFPMPLVHSLALDSQNHPHFSFLRYTSYPQSSYHELRYRSDSTDEYGALVDGGPEVGFYSSLALDSQDRAHISYYDQANGDLKYARWDGNAWVLETVDSDGNVGSYTSLALDESDRPHISYFDVTNLDLKYAFWDGSLWQIETVDSPGNVGQYSSLALGVAGTTHFSYYDATNQKLKYATNAGASEHLIFLPLLVR